MYNVPFLNKLLKTLVLALIRSVGSYVFVIPNTGCSQSALCSQKVTPSATVTREESAELPEESKV